MGVRTWGFLIKSSEHVDDVLYLVKKHNSLCADEKIMAEPLEISSIVKDLDAGNLYIECMNGGGGDNTSQWIETGSWCIPKIYYPFAKPTWWNNDSKVEYVWKLTNTDGNKNEFVSPFDLNTCQTSRCLDCEARHPRKHMLNGICSFCKNPNLSVIVCPTCGEKYESLVNMKSICQLDLIKDLNQRINALKLEVEHHKYKPSQGYLEAKDNWNSNARFTSFGIP